MSSGSTHLERTSDSSRREILSDATVEDITDVSPSVKKLVLNIHDRNFTFSPGQWVDFFAPNVSRVGGFSMCSSPHKLQFDGLMDLAVKYSTQEPAFWVHTKCKPGSKVQVKVGGDFHYDSTSHRSHDLLLIAGGVGINPLLSILHTVSELQPTKSTTTTTAVHEQRVVLLYSVKTREELIFKNDIEEICKSHSRVVSQYHITGDDQSKLEETDQTTAVRTGRINGEVLDSVVKTFFPHKENLVCFLCGPGQMIDDMESILIQLGLSNNQIHFEKWW